MIHMVVIVVRYAPDELDEEAGDKLLADYRANWFPRLGQDPEVIWHIAHKQADEVLVTVRAQRPCYPACNPVCGAFPWTCVLGRIAAERPHEVMA